MRTNLRAVVIVVLLLTSFIVVITPTTQAVGTPGQNDDLWRQLASGGSNGASQSCSVHYQTTSANPVQLTGGVNYIYASGVGVGGLTAVSINLHASNGTTLISTGINALATGGGVDATKVIQWASIGAGNGFYNITQFQMPYTASVYLDYSFSGSSSCFTQDGFVVPLLPTGISAGNQLAGWIADAVAFCSGCAPTTKVVGYFLNADITPISEAGILGGCTNCVEATKSPTTTQFGWTQIANDQTLVNTATSDNTDTVSGLQSFTADLATKGKFIDTTAFRLKQAASGCNGATLTWAVSASNAYPWNVTAELANLTTAITSTSSATTVGVTIDWSNGLISNSAPFTFATPTAKASGNSVTIGSASFLSNFPPTMAAGGTFYLHWNIQSNPGTCAVEVSTANPYSGGSYYSDSGSAWSQVANSDLSGWVMNVYGGVPITYTFTLNDKNVGGAYYSYICEVQKDATPQQYNFTSSFGGRAKATGYQAAGNSICASVVSTIGGTSVQQTIQEWRMGYDSIPRNATSVLTLTFDTGGSSRNLLYIGVFAGTQPLHPHVSGPLSFTASGYNSLPAYVIFSTDDYFTQLTFTVYECANSDCSAFGNVSTTAAYLVTICPGTFQRQVSGTVNSTGNLVVTGQDIPGCQVRIDLSGTGYSLTTWTNNIGNSGTFTFNVGVFLGGASTGQFLLGAVSVTFSPSDPVCLVTGQNLQSTIVRSRSTDLYVALYKLDTNGVPQLFEQPIFYWTATLSNNITFNSSRSPLSVSDTGQYVLAVSFLKTNASQNSLVGFERIGVNVPCTFTVGTSALSTIDSITQQQVTKVNPAASGTPVPTVLSLEDRSRIALDNMFGSYLFGIPNMVLILIVLVAFGAAMRFHGGNGRNGP